MHYLIRYMTGLVFSLACMLALGFASSVVRPAVKGDRRDDA